MPDPIVQASPGGTCPRTDSLTLVSKHVPIDRQQGGEQEGLVQGADRSKRDQEQDQQASKQGQAEEREDQVLGHHQGERQDDHHHLHPQHLPHGDEAVPTAGINRMPDPIAQSSPGGNCPRTDGHNSER